MSILPAQDFIQPRPQRGGRTQYPLNLPGLDYDGSPHHDVTLHYRAAQQLTVLDLGGSTLTNNVTTLTVTPNLTAHGSAWADDLPALVVSFTTGATQTIPAVAAGLVAAVTAAITISSLADVSNFARWADFVTVVVNAGDNTKLDILARDAGAKFTVTLTSTGSVTSTQTTENGTDVDLLVGIFAVRSGREANGVAYGGAPVAASTASQIAGIVMDGPDTRPVSAGWTNKSYAPGKAARIREWGTATVYSETATTADAPVYARKTASGTEIAGAASGTAVLDTQQVFTLTPTPVDSTQYAFQVRVTNYFTGEFVTQGIVQFTSGVGTNATLICNGLRTSLLDDNDQLDGIVVGGGTTTLTLTPASPYVITVAPFSVGVLSGFTTPTTAAASDHILIAGARFCESTSAAGIAAVELPHP